MKKKILHEIDEWIVLYSDKPEIVRVLSSLKRFIKVMK